MSVRSATLVFLFAIFASSAAGAQDTREQEWRAACTHDALVHCTFPALRGDRTGVRNCLLKRLAKISPRCRADVEGGSADNDRTTDEGPRLDEGAQGSPENGISPR
jgi:hypothetical protein